MVGGGDTALEEALYLTKYGKHIHLLVRSKMRASKTMQVSDLRRHNPPPLLPSPYPPSSPPLPPQVKSAGRLPRCHVALKLVRASASLEQILTILHAAKTGLQERSTFCGSFAVCRLESMCLMRN